MKGSCNRIMRLSKFLRFPRTSQIKNADHLSLKDPFIKLLIVIGMKHQLFKKVASMDFSTEFPTIPKMILKVLMTLCTACLS